MRDSKNIRSICIVGGGSAGWMAACLLASILRRDNINITLIESPDIATVGVGESTVPSIFNFLQACKIDPRDFVSKTSGSFKLGIRFDDWWQPGENFFHPFGRVGKEINGFDFYQAWLKARAEGDTTDWLDHSPSAVMAREHRFMMRPGQTQDWTLNSYSYALHLDAVLAARYWRDHAQKNGAKRIEATVSKVETDNNHFIRSLMLTDGTHIESDFFIDCTGFSALLIEKALHVGYEDWAHYLPCNRAVTVQTESVGDPAPYTVATAQDAGWSWRIPLQHRTGNGYVYASQYCSDDEALATLYRSVEGRLLNEPKVIPFSTGKRTKVWHNNCLSLGLASGFLEPLESTAIHLVYKTLIHFLAYFPDADFDPCVESAFNQKMNDEYQEIRDFIILHYCTSKRSDTEFWQNYKSKKVPDSLREKLQIFRERGHLVRDADAFFSVDSWCSILEGMNVRPKRYHPLMDQMDGKSLAKSLQDGALNIQQVVESMPMHGDYLKTHCPTKS